MKTDEPKAPNSTIDKALIFTPQTLFPSNSQISPNSCLEAMRTGTKFMTPNQWLRRLRARIDQVIIPTLKTHNLDSLTAEDYTVKLENILNDPNLAYFLQDQFCMSTIFPDWINPQDGTALSMRFNPERNMVDVRGAFPNATSGTQSAHVIHLCDNPSPTKHTPLRPLPL